MLAGPSPSSFSVGSLPSTMPQQLQTSPHVLPKQFPSPILPPGFQSNRQHHPTKPPENATENYPPQPTVTNGMNQPQIEHPYLHSGLTPASVANPHYSPLPTLSNPQFSNLQYLPSDPSLAKMPGSPPYTNNHYSEGHSSYNGPPVGFPLGSSSPPTTHYPSHPAYPNLSGPPPIPATQMNGLGSYPGQPSLKRPVQQQQQSSPPSRVDSDIVPSVIQVLEDNQAETQKPFITNAPGLLPPLVSTNFLCQDQGSCNPRFVRATTYTLPNTADMVKQSQIPIALSISPLANLRADELEPPLSNFGEIGPVRCHRCKAYMCSFMRFTDGGKRFICCFCEATTDVPNEYFNHLDHTGCRIDKYQRPELCLGSYEILATKQYCKDEKWPEPPAFIFMIDVSYTSVRSGLVEYICQILKTDLLDYLPKDKNAEKSTVRVGFATFDKQIHFYNIKNTLGQPQMMVVSDLEDAFVPLLDGFLSSPEDSRGVVNNLLDQIPQTFANALETETILEPVIRSGMEALKEANCCGKIYVFSTALPLAIAPGKLTNRDDRKLLGTEKEKILLSPVNNIYTKLGEECVQNGCAVDLFVFSNTYLDLATTAEVCRVSGGDICKYNYFSVDKDGERLFDDLKRNFQRTTVFDALIRARTSTGIRPIDFVGNFHMTNATEMVFGTMDSTKSITVELKHDDKLPVENNIYIQIALLYTSISGQRRLRILTLALTVTSSYASLYAACDLDAIMNYMTKVAIRSIASSTPKSIRANIITQTSNILACYHKNCAQGANAGQLILPNTLKRLPVYVASLLKSDVLIGTQTITTDDRRWLMHRLISMDIKGTSGYLYPRIYPLHNLEENRIPPSMIRCLYERFSDAGAYVIENGLVMYIWLGSQIDPAFVQCLFGAQSGPFQAENCRVMELDNSVSRNVRALMKTIRDERHSHMNLSVIQQHNTIELFFRNYLVEDKGITGGASSVDFLFQIHREIRNILQ